MSTIKLVILAAVAAVATEVLLVLGRHLTGEAEGYMTFFHFCFLPGGYVGQEFALAFFPQSWVGTYLAMLLAVQIQWFLIYLVALLIWRHIHARDGA